MGKATEYTRVAVDKLIPYVNNAKQHSDSQVTKIASSIREFGFLNPVLIDASYNVIAGHGRILAAKKLQMDEVPCLFVEGLTDAQRKAYILADNRLSELGEWDMELVMGELAELDELGFDVELTGFDMPEELPEAVEDDFDESAIPDEPRAKLGDLWQLGEHRLICGDSTDVSVIKRLMGGVKADLLLTDPPYGISVVAVDKIGGDKPFGSKGKVDYGTIGKNKICDCNEYSPIIGDDTTDTARDCYNLSVAYTKDQIIFGGNYFTDFLPPSRCWLVWDKQNTGNFADAELAWTSFDKGVKLYHFLWNGLCREGSREVEGKTRVHPTQKPVGLMGYILNDFTNEEENILDLFGGSGSTLIACEQLNRKCYMCELDPKYVSVILQRYINFKGSDEDVFLLKDGKKIPYSEVK